MLLITHNVASSALLSSCINIFLSTYCVTGNVLGAHLCSQQAVDSITFHIVYAIWA